LLWSVAFCKAHSKTPHTKKKKKTHTHTHTHTHNKHLNYNFTVSNEDSQSVPQTIKHTCNVAHLKSCDDVRQNIVVLESNISQCVQSHIRTSQSITVILHNMTLNNELALSTIC
jgi:ABC-type Zn2+ transport system substrate-binding protein/surface adhesin